MQGKKLSPRSVEWIFLSVTGILFYWLNWYSVLAYDDWYYAMTCEDADFFKPVSGRSPIESIGDIFVSQWNHYQYVNGRFLLHFIVQLFVGILGLRAFQVANTVMFVLLIKYLCRLCIPVQHRNRFMYYILTFLIFWFIMGFVNIGLGYYTCISFSVNYLWPSTLFVIVIYLWYNNKDENFPIVKGIGLFVLSLLCGASSETFSVGLSGTLFLYYCFNLKLFRGAARYVSIGLWVGTAILLFSPANFSRFVGANGGGLLREFFLRFFWLGTNWKLIVPVLILCIALVITGCINKCGCRSVIKRYSMLLNALVLTFVFLFVVGFKGNYQMFMSISLVVVIVVMRLIFIGEKILLKNDRLVVSAGMIILIGCYLIVLNGRNIESEKYNEAVSEYTMSDFKTVEFKDSSTPFNASCYVANMSRRYLKFSIGGLAIANNVEDLPVIIPENDGTFDSYRIVMSGDGYVLRDAGWCYIVETESPELYRLTATEFTHRNFLLRMYAAFSDYATTMLQLETYPVTIGEKKYLIVIKGSDDFIINRLRITATI